MTLLAVAAGTQPVEFELDPTGSSVHFADQDGQTMSWQDLPSLPTGFFTLDAEGLGGVLRPAVVPPGVYGAIAFEASPPAGAKSVSILVAGWIDRRTPGRDPSRPLRGSHRGGTDPRVARATQAGRRARSSEVRWP